MVNTWDKIKMRLRWNRRTDRPRKSRRSISKSNKRRDRSRGRSSNRSSSRSSTSPKRRDSRNTSIDCISNINSSPASNYSISSPKLRKHSSSRSGLFGCLSNAPPKEYPDGPEPNNTNMSNMPIHLRTVSRSPPPRSRSHSVVERAVSSELLGAASPLENVENSSKFIKDSFSPYIPSRSPSMELQVTEEQELRDQDGAAMAMTPTPANRHVTDHYGAMTPAPVFDTPISPGADLTSFEDIYEGVKEEGGSGKIMDEEGMQPQALYDIESIDVNNLVYHYFNDSDQSDDDDMTIGGHVGDDSVHSVHEAPVANSVANSAAHGDRLEEEEKREFTPRGTQSVAMKGEMYHYPSCERVHNVAEVSGVEGVSAGAPTPREREELYHRDDLEAIQDREFIEELKRNGIDHPEEIMQPVWDQQIENERGPQIMGILKQFCEPEPIVSDDRIEAPLPPIPQSPYNPIPIDRTERCNPSILGEVPVVASPNDNSEDSDIFNKMVKKQPAPNTVSTVTFGQSTKFSKSCSALPAIPSSVGLRSEEFKSNQDANHRSDDKKSRKKSSKASKSNKKSTKTSSSKPTKAVKSNMATNPTKPNKTSKTSKISKSSKWRAKSKTPKPVAPLQSDKREGREEAIQSVSKEIKESIATKSNVVKIPNMTKMDSKGKVKEMIKDYEAAASMVKVSKPPAYTHSQSVPKSLPGSRSVSRQRAGSAPVVTLPVREELRVQNADIFHRKYTMGRKINEGGFGSVWRIRDNHPTAKCVKIMELGHDETSYARKRKQCMREFSMTYRAFADEMVQTELFMEDIGATDEPKAYLVMPYFKGKDLFEYIDDEEYPEKINDGIILHIFYKIVEKMYDLHYLKNIVHGDLKPENVMILQCRESGEIEVEIIDYGIAKSLRNLTSDSKYLKSKGHFGTKGYVAPELMTESRYNRKIDVFSLGVVLYNMVTECCLFTKGHKYYKMTQNEYYKYLKRKLKPIRKKTAIINLLYSCLTYDPDERLDVKKLLDRYFQSRR